MNKLPTSPLAPKRFASLPPIEGVEFAVAKTGSYYQGRDDFLMMKFAKGSTVAGMFSKTSMPSTAVDLCRQHLARSKGKIRGLVVNAGNANAFTGKAGAKASHAITAHAAREFGCAPENILIASTGVIGKLLEPAPFLAALSDYKPVKSWRRAASAIMTTDTFAKGVTRRAKFGRQIVTINVIAKGSGMVAPDMNTMLAFAFTDAAIPAGILKSLIRDATAESFNAITVDSDRSTSDTLLLVATGAKKCVSASDGAPLRSAKDKRLAPFKRALHDALQEAAIQVVSDGEGASKLMTINISGAVDAASARQIGLSIGNSPLVKTAIAGEDANWGRIVMAVGKSGEPANRDRMSIKIGGHVIAKNGRAIAGYDETPIARHLKQKHIQIDVNVGMRGKGTARIWACDLTHGYISINADYRS